MKYFLLTAFVLVSLSGCTQNKDTNTMDVIPPTSDTISPDLSMTGITDITPSEAIELIQQSGNDDLQIIDIRTSQEYFQSHIDRASNIDFFAPDFKSQLGLLNPKKPVLLYCRSGNRSSQSLEIFKELGFETIYHLKDGYQSYEELTQ